MANRFYSEVSVGGDTRASASKAKDGPRGSAKAAPAVKERTAKWPEPGPVSKTSFNRATKMPVVKTRAAKRGIA